MVWTRSQRMVLITLVFGFSLVLLVRIATNRAYVSNPPPVEGELAEELASRIDPNVATWQELAVLPQLGEKSAKEFVAWRERFAAEHQGEVPFRRLEDLLRVKGIGPSLLETLRPHLTFPAAYNPVATTRMTERR